MPEASPNTSGNSKSTMKIHEVDTGNSQFHFAIKCLFSTKEHLSSQEGTV